MLFSSGFFDGFRQNMRENIIRNIIEHLKQGSYFHIFSFAGFDAYCFIPLLSVADDCSKMDIA